jgi:hypothetical protein
MLKVFQKTKNDFIKYFRDCANDYGNNPDQSLSRYRDRESELMKSLDSMLELASELDHKMRRLERRSINFEERSYLSQEFDKLHKITYDVLQLSRNFLLSDHPARDQIIDLRCAIRDYAEEFEKEKTSEEILEHIQYYLAGKDRYGGSVNYGFY